MFLLKSVPAVIAAQALNVVAPAKAAEAPFARVASNAVIPAKTAEASIAPAVIPAKAGIQHWRMGRLEPPYWTPAFAGVTGFEDFTGVTVTGAFAEVPKREGFCSMFRTGFRGRR